MRALLITTALMMTACTHQTGNSPAPETDTSEWVDLSSREKPDAITTHPWTEIVVGVPDLEDAPRLFIEIGGFTDRYGDEKTKVLGAQGVETGLIRFEKTEVDDIQTRPFGSRSWDTGCYFSIMMRAKDIPSIVDDAKALGWEPLTDIAYLEFGPSKLNIVVLGHEATGIQVQLYERLTTPLPEGFPDFERLSRPFNMMQMVRDRDAAYTFYQQLLGFDTFYYGKPYVSKEPVAMPLGIPKELTTSVPYKAGITTPEPGLEWGRMEMIEVMMEDGQDLSKRCQPGNIGITEVRFEVEDFDRVFTALKARGAGPSYTLPDDHMLFKTESVLIKTPDGANIRFIGAAE